MITIDKDGKLCPDWHIDQNPSTPDFQAIFDGEAIPAGVGEIRDYNGLSVCSDVTRYARDVFDATRALSHRTAVSDKEKSQASEKETEPASEA